MDGVDDCARLRNLLSLLIPRVDTYLGNRAKSAPGVCLLGSDLTLSMSRRGSVS
jgi:hypothetical protein